ncbi:MAG: hypothetical protein AB8B78_06430 [Polaribacter sp.]
MILGVVLLYWIGKYFYKLAEKYNKNQWGFAILGVVSYYGGIYVSAFIIGIIAEILSPDFFIGFDETVFALLLIPFGFLSCYLLYKYLEKTWKKNDSRFNNKIDEIGKIE